MQKLIPEEAVQVEAKPTYVKSNKVLVIVLSFLLALMTICSVFFIIRYFNKPSYTSEKPISLWTMKLRPSGGVDSFNFCKTNGITGFGWGLAGTPSTIQEYRSIRRQESRYPNDKMLDNTLDSFENITTGTGHTYLVWTVDSNGYWYIMEITGQYQYNRDGAHEKAGIVNFVQCTFYCIGTEDLVPNSVVDAYNSEGIINFVHNDQKAIDITRALWNVAKTKNQNETIETVLSAQEFSMVFCYAYLNKHAYTYVI